MSDHLDFDNDAALSAELDGELDAFARELGTDANGIRTRLSATPGTDARRAELQTVRDQVRIPVPPLDELSRARVLAAAIANTPPADIDTSRRTSHWVGRAAAAAVVVLALVGGGYLLARNDDSNRSSKSASSRSTAPAIATGELGDLGAISRDQIDRLIGGPKAGVAVPAPLERSNAADAAPRLATGAKSADPSASTSRPSPQAVLASRDQVQACRSAYQKLGTIRFDASGTYQGRPAVVLGINRAPRVIVFVVAADDCQRVLLSLSR